MPRLCGGRRNIPAIALSVQVVQRPRPAPNALTSAQAACAALALAACGATLGPHIAGAKTAPAALSLAEPAPLGEALTPIVNEDDYVVRVVVGSLSCSGALIRADRVLTAHHCVAARDGTGRVLNRNVDAASVRVELGGDYLPWGEVGVRAILAPTCGYVSGDGDLAILILERALTGLATHAARTEAPPSPRDSVDPIGFGRCAHSDDGIRRKRRLGGPVELVSEGRFRLAASICPGDSGGPAISRESGEILGVISASAMDADEFTRDPSEFVRIDRWRSLFVSAALVSNGTSPSELAPIKCQ